MAIYRLNKSTGKIEKKEDEHPTYVTFLQNQPPSNLKGYPYDQHRRTSPKAYSNPSHGASGGTGGTTSFTLTDWAKPTWSIPLREPNPSPPNIPHAGIRTGELIGYRGWRVIGTGLYSLVADHRWKPGATELGDVDRIIDRWFSYITLEQYYIYGGIYAFKDVREIGQRSFNDSNISVIGTVKLWGEVVEHELGYRAQFAKITSLTATRPGLDHILQPYLDAINDSNSR